MTYNDLPLVLPMYFMGITSEGKIAKRAYITRQTSNTNSYCVYIVLSHSRLEVFSSNNNILYEVLSICLMNLHLAAL